MKNPLAGIASASRNLGTVQRCLICGALGLVLGIGGTLFVLNFNPPDRWMPTASSVFGRIVQRNELVSVTQSYQIVEKVTDTNKFFDLFDIPFTQNSFWYRYAGDIKAGVNLKTANLEVDGTSVRITLDKPYIIANEPNMDVSGVLEENNNALNPIHVEDVDAFQRQCIETSRESAVNDGLLEEAHAAAEENIREIFKAALGDECTVEFEYRSEEDTQ